MNATVLNKHFSPAYGVGFTLIELIVSVTVIAVLLILALPAFQSLLMNDRVMAAKDALANSLNYARNAALSQNVTVIVCPFNSLNSTTCGSNWQRGWIVVTQPAGGNSVLLQANAAAANDPAISSIAVNGVAAASVSFDTRGIATTQANFKVCDSRGGAFAHSVEVLPTGFVQSGSTVGRAVWDGGALACP